MTTVLNGYSAKLTGPALDAVLADTNVAYVTKDAIYSIGNMTTHSVRTSPAPRPRAALRRNHHHPLGTGVDYYGVGETVLCAV